MKPIGALLAAICLGTLAGCGTVESGKGKTGLSTAGAELKDPSTQEEVLPIVTKIIEKRENWSHKEIRPNIVQTLLCHIERTNAGGWRVTARKCIAEENSCNCGYADDHIIEVVLDGHGKVIHYSRHRASLDSNGFS